MGEKGSPELEAAQAEIASLRAQLAQQQEDEAEMLAIVHMQGVASRDDEVRELKAQLAGAREAALEEAAKVAIYEGIHLSGTKHRTRNLGLPRDAYPTEVGRAIAAAIRTLAAPQEGESVIRKSTELLTDNNRISGESDAKD